MSGFPRSDLSEGTDQEPDIPERHRGTGDPLFARNGLVERDPLGAARGRDPLLGEPVHPLLHIDEQLDLPRDRQARERLRGVFEPGEARVQLALLRGRLRGEGTDI
jgi:hypothetical protein